MTTPQDAVRPLDPGSAERIRAWRLRGAAHDRAMESRVVRLFGALVVGAAVALAYTLR